MTGPRGVCAIGCCGRNVYCSLLEARFLSGLRTGGQKVNIREQLLTALPLLKKEVHLQFDLIDGVKPRGWSINNLECQQMTGLVLQ